MCALRSLLVATLAISLLSGCISAGSFDDGSDETEVGHAPEPTIVVRSETETATMPAGATVIGDDQQGPTFEVDAPAGVLDMELVLSRDVDATDLRITIREADQDVTQYDWIGKRFTVSLDDPGIGTTEVSFGAMANAETEITLDSTVRWLQAEGGLEEAVRVVRDGDRYRAEITYFTSRAVDDHVEADIDLFNGAIDISGEPDVNGNASATVTTWARAASEARAREMVLDLRMRLDVDSDSLTAVVDDRTDRRDNEGTGATGSFHVPATVSGLVDTSNGAVTVQALHAKGLTVDTSNGKIVVDRVRADDLDLDTSNGKVTGSLSAQGRLGVDTSNGDIDLRIDPTDDLDLQVDTSNGDIDLRLTTDAQHSYDLEVDTSNGKVTESMDETSFQATDDDHDEGRLKTDGGSRAIHTSGMVDTSNGDVHFADA